MIELLAGVLVAAAVLAYVLEPLAREPRSTLATAEEEPVTAEKLIEEMRGRLLSHCPACGSPADPGSAFCSSCGSILLK